MTWRLQDYNVYKCNISKQMVSIKRPMMNCKDNPGKGALKSVLKSLRTYLGYQVFSMCLVFFSPRPDPDCILVSSSLDITHPAKSSVNLNNTPVFNVMNWRWIPSPASPVTPLCHRDHMRQFKVTPPYRTNRLRPTHIDSWDHDIPSTDPA